jgi:hypothetical protein
VTLDDFLLGGYVICGLVYAAGMYATRADAYPAMRQLFRTDAQTHAVMAVAMVAAIFLWLPFAVYIIVKKLHK